jgi:pimeloyl-ACP methyl ester carboxylesterase
MAEIALVLLPGLHGNDVQFRPLLAHLPQHIRPITVNYPLDQTLDYAQLLPLVMAALPPEMPFVLLGESFSGPLAIMAAATRPTGLRGVILCATFVRNPLWLRPSWLRVFAHGYTFYFFAKLTRVSAIFLGCGSPETRALYDEARVGLKPAVLAHRVRAVLRVDVRRELAACAVPILYLRADRDRLVRRHNLAEISQIRPDVQSSSVEAPHMVLQIEPAAAAAAISEFLGKLELGGTNRC